MIDAPVGIAFAAGLVATVNPCGFAMLPAYLSYFIGLDDTAGEPDDAGLAQALRVGATVSAGFLVVFGATGVLVNAGVRTIIDVIPFVAFGVGILMTVLGIAMWRGYQLNIATFTTGRGPTTRSTRSVFTFGVSYALASLSCTLPVFLSVVVGSIASASFVSGLVTFLAYAIGMSVVLLALTIAMASAKHGVVRRMRSVLPYVQRISAGFLIVAGLYIVWFWYDDLASDAGQQSQASGLVEGWSASVTNWIGDNSVLVGLTLGGIVAIAVLNLVLKRFEPVADASGRHSVSRSRDRT